MFVILFFLVGGMALTWLGVVIYAVVKVNAEIKLERMKREDHDRALEEMDTSGETWEWTYPEWYLEKYGRI